MAKIILERAVAGELDPPDRMVAVLRHSPFEQAASAIFEGGHSSRRAISLRRATSGLMQCNNQIPFFDNVERVQGAIKSDSRL